MNGLMMNDSLYQPEWNAIHDTIYLPELSHTYTYSDMSSQLDAFCGNWTIGWAFGLFLLVGILLFSNLCPCIAKFVNWVLKIFNYKHRRTLSVISLCVWLFGTIIYIIGFYDSAIIVNTSSFFHNFMYGISLFMRAAISSLAMFLTRTDWALLNAALQQSWLYGLIFISVHVCALFLTVGLILRLFFYQSLVKTQLKAWKKDGSHICILWGMNSASIALAQDIKEKEINKKEEKKKESYHCVFVLENDSQIKSGKLSFANLLGIRNNSLDAIEQAEALDAVVIYGMMESILDIIIRKCLKIKTNKGANLINHKVSISSVKSATSISSTDTVGLRLFILSKDEFANLDIADKIHKYLFVYGKRKLKWYQRINLSNYRIVKWRIKKIDYAMIKDKLIMFCHARRTSSNLLFEYDINEEANLTVETEGIKKKYFRIVDSAYLSVLSLKTDIKALPINYVNIETINVDGKNLSIGAVSGEFISLVLGFGEVGQEALEFLYEYSSFVRPNGSPAPHKCIAID